MYLGVGGTLRDRIPEATVARLPVYLRCLVDMSERGTHRVSSDQLAEAAGVNSAKVRKDLSYLGSYGTRGVGYDVEYLIYQVRRELGLEQDWSVAIVGVGNLGHALANYRGFVERGFKIAALLDADVGKVGEQVGELTVDHIDDLDRVVKEEQVAIGIIATPATAAQEVCDRLVVAGANFRSAPLGLLERLAVDPERRPKALARLLDAEHVHEGVIVSTCNRVEVYTAISRFHGGAGDVRRFLADLHGIGVEEFADHLYDYYEERAVRHLFAVASGIDSMVVGEAQILGQVREAFQAAQAERTVGPVLSGLFARAIKVGRRARRETGIGAGLASTLTVGLRVVREHLGDLDGRRVLLVGAGGLARLAGRTLRQAGAGELVV